MCKYYHENEVEDDDNNNGKAKRKNRWMNPKCHPYRPTILEHYANVLTHGVRLLKFILLTRFKNQYLINFFF